MGSFFQTIFTLLLSPPGSLLAHLTLIIALMAAFQLVLLGQRPDSSSTRRRALLGLSLMLLGQLVLFFASALAWQNLIDPRTVLPPLDRLTTTWCLAWAIWLWSFPRPSRLADLANGLISLLLLTLFLFTLAAWSPQAASTSFNATWLYWLWIAVPLFILLIGLIFIMVERPERWELGLGFLLIHLLGYGAAILWYEPGQHYPAAIRLAMLCAYPLLPALGLRFYRGELKDQRTLAEEPVDWDASAGAGRMERRRYTAEPRAVYAWLQVAQEQQPDTVATAITRAVAQTLLADLCYLVSSPDESGKIEIRAGYDLVRDEPLPGGALDSSRIPTLSASIQRGRPLRISDSQSLGDLKVLGEAIGLEQPGTLLLIPLVAASRVWGALLLLCPYSNRSWNTGDQSYLMTVTETITRILMRVEQHASLPLDTHELEQLHQKLESLQKENQQLAASLEGLRKITQNSGDLQALPTLQDESQETIARLQAENNQLRATLEASAAKMPIASSEESSYLEHELRAALEETARLQNALAGANMKILTLEMQVKQLEDSRFEGQDLIASILQELRHPITSIIGYNEILLSETAGILGKTQRKFLERIQEATNRLRTLLNEMLKITFSEGRVEWDLEPVDMNIVIDKALAETSDQLRQKNIALQVDIPEDLPRVYADQDAIEQIVIHLLQNAGSVTPEEGTILLTLQTKMSDDLPWLLLQVTDSGGGVAPEDLPRLFWRHHRVEGVTIKGIGNSGVGLSIARTLVEAYGGRIWADSVPGQTTTFSVLLPVGNRPMIKPADRDQSAAPEASHENTA